MLEDAGGGWADLKTVLIERDSSGNLASSEEQVLTIDEYHNIKSISLRMSFLGLFGNPILYIVISFV